MRTNRRQFLAALAATPAVAVPAMANAAGNTSGDALFSLADLRGTANANELGLRPGAIDDQSRLFQSILEKAASENKPVFLPPGNYFVSNILLPTNTRLMGVPGASRLIYSGNGHFIIGENGSHVELTGLVFDGANRGLHSYAEAALRLTNIDHAVIDNCLVVGSIEKGIQIDRSAGRIERSKVTGAGGDCGIYGIENRGLSILSNEVSDCVNGGILVHRWNAGEDGTLLRGNRISA